MPKTYRHRRMKVFPLALLVIALTGCGRDVGVLDARDREEPLMKRALAKQMEGNAEAALKLYEQALRNNPELARAHLDLALIMHDRLDEGKRDYVGAIYHYRKYLQLRHDTDKAEMIRERIRLAGHAFAGKALGKVDVRPEPVVKEDGSGERERELLSRLDQMRARTSELESKVAELELALRQSEEASEMIRSAGRTEAIARIDRLEAENSTLRKEVASLNRLLRESQATVADLRNQLEARNETVEAGSRRTYRVKRGDTLSTIAVRVYGDASEWKRIYDANKEIVEGLDRLKVGQLLIIP